MGKEIPVESKTKKIKRKDKAKSKGKSKPEELLKNMNANFTKNPDQLRAVQVKLDSNVSVDKREKDDGKNKRKVEKRIFEESDSSGSPPPHRFTKETLQKTNPIVKKSIHRAVEGRSG